MAAVAPSRLVYCLMLQPVRQLGIALAVKTTAKTFNKYVGSYKLWWLMNTRAICPTIQQIHTFSISRLALACHNKAQRAVAQLHLLPLHAYQPPRISPSLSLSREDFLGNLLYQ